MALLLGLVESLEMTAPPTSPVVGTTGQRNHPGDWQSLDGVGMVLIGPTLLTILKQK